jgi:hypothetical protein
MKNRLATRKETGKRMNKTGETKGTGYTKFKVLTAVKILMLVL